MSEQKYEYKTVSVSPTVGARWSIQEKVQSVAEDGWRFVEMIYDGGTPIEILFEREV